MKNEVLLNNILNQLWLYCCENQTSQISLDASVVYKRKEYLPKQQQQQQHTLSFHRVCLHASKVLHHMIIHMHCYSGRRDILNRLNPTNHFRNISSAEGIEQTAIHKLYTHIAEVSLNSFISIKAELLN